MIKRYLWIGRITPDSRYPSSCSEPFSVWRVWRGDMRLYSEEEMRRELEGYSPKAVDVRKMPGTEMEFEE